MRDRRNPIIEVAPRISSSRKLFCVGDFSYSRHGLEVELKGKFTMERINSWRCLITNLGLYALKGQHKVILESIPRDKETARFSILAYNPVFEIKFENGVLYQNGQVIDRDPLDFLYQVTHKSQHHSDLPFGGGAIGFVGYDMISLYEEIGQNPSRYHWDTRHAFLCL